jgi:hypothetical protein
LAEQRAIGIAVSPAFATRLFLRFVVAANACGCSLQSIALLGGQAIESSFQFSLR